MSNTVNVSTTTNQVVITPQSTKTVSVNSGDDTSITVNQGGSNTVNISNNVVNTSLTPTTVDITTPPSNGITVTDLRKTITVNQGITSTVQVATIGPQGPKGDRGDTGEQGPTGPVQDTGSLLKNASYTNPLLTFTRGNNTNFSVEIETTTPTLAEVTAQGSSTTTPITASSISASGTIKGNIGSFNSIEGFISNDGNNRILTSDGDGTFTAEDSFTLNNGALGGQFTSFQMQSQTPFAFDAVPVNFDNKITIDGPNGHITASGNISASGDIRVNEYYIGIAKVMFSEGGQFKFGNTGGPSTVIEGSSITLNANATSSGNISASGDLTANSLTISTSSVQDTYMMFIPRTSDGIANRSSYFLSFSPSSEALKHSNFNTNFNISSSVYFNRVIACDDMTIADGKSIDITGILHVEGATFSSNQVQIDLYTASITPNNTFRLPEPLEFTRAFLGDDILIDATPPNLSSHHFTQSFDISTLSPNSVIAVALSNSSAATPVTTNTNVNLSLRLTRNYKKKN